jgi:hypothetical protein
MKLTCYAQHTFPVSLPVFKIFKQNGLCAVYSQYKSKNTRTTMVCAHFLSCLKWLSYKHESNQEKLNTVLFIGIVANKQLKILSCLHNSYSQPLVNVLQTRIRKDLHAKHFYIRVVNILYSYIQFSDSGMWQFLSQTRMRCRMWFNGTFKIIYIHICMYV